MRDKDTEAALRGTINYPYKRYGVFGGKVARVECLQNETTPKTLPNGPLK